MYCRVPDHLVKLFGGRKLRIPNEGVRAGKDECIVLGSRGGPRRGVRTSGADVLPSRFAVFGDDDVYFVAVLRDQEATR